jgi:hypothetical protein
MKAGTATVQLTPVGNPVTSWDMSLDNGGKKGAGQYPEIRVNKGDTKEVTYSIVQPTPPAAQISWAENAFCAVPGTKKPKANQYCDNKVFSWKIKDGNLVVNDNNSHSGQMDYYYVVNFDNNVVSLDPIYNNGGTSKGFAYYSSTELGGIVLALAFIALIAWSIIRARAGRGVANTNERIRDE